MSEDNVDLPYVDYTKNFVRIRVLNPKSCRKDSFRTNMVGMFSRFKVVWCKPHDKTMGNQRIQTILIPTEQWNKDDLFARENIVLALGAFDRKVCVGGLSEDDKIRFKEFACK